ncbi:MAG: hypothetical protein JXR79_09865 [Nitrospirae bacterium]|nr:hypothetical protein [Nitrospirota bacterium]
MNRDVYQCTRNNVDLDDYLKIIKKRKNILVAIFFVSILLAIVYGLFMPKVYRGVAIIQMMPNEIVSSSELKKILSAGGVEAIFQDKADLVKKFWVSELDELAGAINITIEATSRDDMFILFSKVKEYINNSKVIKVHAEESRNKIIKQIQEISNVLKDAEIISNIVKKQIEANRLASLGFNPLDISENISKLNMQKFNFEQALKRNQGVDFLSYPSISNKHVKPKLINNILLAGFLSLFFGVFFVFILEQISRLRLNR